MRPAVLFAGASALVLHGFAAWQLFAPEGRWRASPPVSDSVVHVRSIVPSRPNERAAEPVPAPAGMAGDLIPAAASKPMVDARSPAAPPNPIGLSSPQTADSTTAQMRAEAAAPGLSPAANPSRETVATTPPASPPQLAAAPQYLSSSQMDPGPRLLGDVEPAFPSEAGQQEGTVVLRILIADSGAIDDVAVVRSYPRGLFEAAALAAWKTAKFEPGRVLGVPTKSQMTIEVTFAPINRGSTVSGRAY